MKRVVFLLIILLAALINFSSCGKKEDMLVIGVSQCSEDEWRNKMNKEIIREALFYDNLDVEIRSANDDSQKQIDDIEYFISKDVDLLVVAPNQSEAVSPIIEKAYNMGIPVIVVDRSLNTDNYTAYIGADNYEIGKIAGEYIGGLLGGKGKVIEINGLSGSTPAMARNKGFADAISAYPGVEIVAKIDGEWLKETAFQRSDSLFASGTEAQVVFAQNDRMASGAYDAAKKYGKEKDLKFIGVDVIAGEGNGLNDILDGKLEASFIYPTGGEKVVQVAMDILNGRPYQKENILSTALVNKDNARLLDLQTTHIDEQSGKIEQLNDKIDIFWKQYSVQKYFLYACIIVILLSLAILIIIIQAYISKNKTNIILSEQKAQLEQQRDQLIDLSKQLEEATHAKLMFFTNVSHDFRTPLTLIADPVKKLMEDKSLSEKSRALLRIIEKNSSVLLRLINQILDIRKYESGKLELSMSNVDLDARMKEWSEAFNALAINKHIRLQFTSYCDSGCLVAVDEEKIERVFFNLLANAFKFTPENGSIKVSLSKGENPEKPSVIIKVEDSGRGIPAATIDQIFDNFYQIDNKHNGSGIGLSLCKSFVELHGGNITVKSIEGKGTVFIVEIPVTVTNQSAEHKESKHAISEVVLNELADDLDQEDRLKEDNRKTLLVIDDNDDIRSYIKILLGDDYNVIEAPDGREGVKMAMRYVPDIIVCDVMMPVMDGLECCKQLKSEVQTSHIPLLMLTASSIDEQRIAGFESGADSFISKPFNSQLLIARIKNLIENRHRLKQCFGENNIVEQESISNVDKSFLEKFKELIDENIGNSELSVEELGRSMGLGRIQLYRKVKALTNYSPNEFLRITRLKKAASLLASSEKTVSEIAFEVGFNSSSYFAKCYKEYFGENPTDFLKRKG